MTLVDTDVLIDFRRGISPAAVWWTSLGNDLPLVPGMVAMEFIGGSINGQQLERARRYLSSLDILWHNEEDSALAFRLLLTHRLSSGLSLADFYIAAQALNQRATLFTGTSMPSPALTPARRKRAIQITERRDGDRA